MSLPESTLCKRDFSNLYLDAVELSTRKILSPPEEMPQAISSAMSSIASPFDFMALIIFISVSDRPKT